MNFYLFLFFNETILGDFFMSSAFLFIILMCFSALWIHEPFITFLTAVLKSFQFCHFLLHMALFLLIDFSLDYGTNIFLVLAHVLSWVWVFVTPWTIAHQAPLPMWDDCHFLLLVLAGWWFFTHLNIVILFIVRYFKIFLKKCWFVLMCSYLKTA